MRLFKRGKIINDKENEAENENIFTSKILNLLLPFGAGEPRTVNLGP